MTSSAATRDVPFFNYRGAFGALGEPLFDTIRDVVGRGAFIMQKDLVEFEQAVAQYLGVKHVFGVGNATDGLIICLRAAGLKPGDLVIVPAHTMVATPASVHFAGGTPVIVDIGADHMMDPAAFEAAITPRTKFVMPVQVNGRTCDMDSIVAIAKKHNIQIVEDAAQALGAKYRGRFAGTFGIASSVSLYPAKVLGCLGDGGLVMTDNDAVADQIHMLRDHGRNRDGDVGGWGMNSRLDNIQAAILHLQFRDYGAILSHRRALATAYQGLLGDLRELVLPAAPDSDPLRYDIFQNYEIEADRRDELKQFLKDRGIGTLVQWGGKAVHQFPALGFKQSLPVTEKFFERCIMLPMNMMVSVEDAEYISAVVRQFYGR